MLAMGHSQHILHQTPPSQALGYDDLVRPCVLLSASNLQVQPTSGQSALPSLQAKDVSVFSQSPRDQHLSAALHHLKAALPVSVLVNLCSILLMCIQLEHTLCLG